MSDTTKLPDGSAFFTADIMSREEAMKLPPQKRPLCFRISSEIYHGVFQAIGAASMQWQPRPSTEVFDSEGASNVATDLCFLIATELEKIPYWGSDLKFPETPAPEVSPSSGVCKIAEERLRQINVKGYTAERDDAYKDHQQSLTPRTHGVVDKLANHRILPNDHCLNGWSSEDFEVLMQHALQLESELAAANEKLDELASSKL